MPIPRLIKRFANPVLARGRAGQALPARGRAANGLPPRKRAQPVKAVFAAMRKGRAPDLDLLSQRIILPLLPTTDEELMRAAYQDRGQKLARQEMWSELSAEIRAADSARDATPGGESAAVLLAFGARGDVVASAEHALLEGLIPSDAGIAALEDILTDHPGDHACALVVAMAHVDLGWAWRHAAGSAPLLSQDVCDQRFAHHFDRATEILAPYCGITEDAPSLAAAQCALLPHMPDPERRVADDYEDLIDLDPHSPRHMRALGQHLLPARLGSYQQLEVEARRTAARTGDIWGAGAYAWVYLDALSLDAGALDLLDTGFFIDGLRDILRHKPDQHIANLLASFCAVAMAPSDGEDSARAALRARLHDCLTWILAENLHELHPLIWTQAARRPGPAPALPPRGALIHEGRRTALRAIAAHFAEDLAAGQQIRFSAAGLCRLPAN